MGTRFSTISSSPSSLLSSSSSLSSSNLSLTCIDQSSSSSMLSHASTPDTSLLSHTLASRQNVGKNTLEVKDPSSTLFGVSELLVASSSSKASESCSSRMCSCEVSPRPSCGSHSSKPDLLAGTSFTRPCNPGIHAFDSVKRYDTRGSKDAKDPFKMELIDWSNDESVEFHNSRNTAMNFEMLKRSSGRRSVLYLCLPIRSPPMMLTKRAKRRKAKGTSSKKHSDVIVSFSPEPPEIIPSHTPLHESSHQHDIEICVVKRSHLSISDVILSAV
mmetsp:Transcript_40017/g.125723  ORF Transcript_40017/g.125723 Transcript_40017/m.125723 type:complete len:273 (+) Transcript_40017:28-846(+)